MCDGFVTIGDPNRNGFGSKSMADVVSKYS